MVTNGIYYPEEQVFLKVRKEFKEFKVHEEFKVYKEFKELINKNKNKYMNKLLVIKGYHLIMDGVELVFIIQFQII
jgi:hypothetical protein